LKKSAGKREYPHQIIVGNVVFLKYLSPYFLLKIAEPDIIGRLEA
jgi:hypothetical protein